VFSEIGGPTGTSFVLTGHGEPVQMRARGADDGVAR
jgi:hypothetical protein